MIICRPLIFFLRIIKKKKIIPKITPVSSSLDPDLGPKCLQRLSTDDCDLGNNLHFVHFYLLTLYLIETPFKAFANIADRDQGLKELPDQGLLCMMYVILHQWA